VVHTRPFHPGNHVLVTEIAEGRIIELNVPCNKVRKFTLSEIIQSARTTTKRIELSNFLTICDAQVRKIFV